MKYISPRSILRFSILLTTATLSLASAGICAGQTSTSPVRVDAISPRTSAIPTAGIAPEARMKIGPGDLIEVSGTMSPI